MTSNVRRNHGQRLKEKQEKNDCTKKKMKETEIIEKESNRNSGVRKHNDSHGQSTRGFKQNI